MSLFFAEARASVIAPSTLARFRFFLRGAIPSKRRLGAGVVCVAIAAHLAGAQTPTPVAGQLPPQVAPMAEVLVPVPTEVFAMLDKFSNCNWRLVQMNGLSHARPHGDETQLALLLGLTIGEGFIAVEAHDTAEVKEIGSAVLALARGVGVQPVVMRRSRGIMEFAEKEDWPAVRREWDAVMPEVQEGMKQIRSEQLAHLVSLGGWLRGTRALTSLILQHYAANDADSLRQPALLDRFEKQLSGMPPNARISKMREGVRRMRDLVADQGQPIPQHSVKDISAMCDELIKTIVTSEIHP